MARKLKGKGKPMAVAPPNPVAVQLSELYFIGALDVVVDLVEALAKDLRQNPHRYRNVEPAAIRTLMDFSRLGANPNWPDREERALLHTSHLGPSDSKAQTKESGEGFPRYARQLRRAAKEFVNRPVNAPAQSLQRSVITSATDFLNYLQNKEGTGLEIHVEELLAIFEVSVGVLMNNPAPPAPPPAPPRRYQPLAAVFGKSRPGNLWPRVRADAAGAELVQEIANQLKEKLDQSSKDGIARFTDLQRMAFYGRETILIVMNEQPQWTVDPQRLIEHAYEWYGARRDYHQKDE